MSSSTIVSVLGDIVRDAQRFIQDTSISQPRFPTCRSPAIPRLCLPDPPSLYPALVAIGADERIANEMNRVYNARALDLRTYYEKAISNAFAALNDFPFPGESEGRILDMFASLYLTKVRSWIEDGVTAYESIRKPTRQIACHSNKVAKDANPRQTFNAGYIPLLEHFFGENTFPTQADKRLLAKKSGMTYRQIHVWFQNRRNRKKKPNTSWGKRPTYEPATLLHNTPRVCIKKSTIYDAQRPCAPTKSRSSPAGECDPIQEDHSFKTTSQMYDNNILDKYTAPLYAFPSPYHSTRSYDPFSLEPRRLLSTFQWERYPNHNASLRSLGNDVNELTDRFSFLSVRDSYSERSQRNYGPTQNLLAATYSITTTPAPAPHPALLQPADFVSSFPRLSPFPMVRAPQPTLEAFTESTPPPILTSPTKSGNVTRRKVSPLPKRHPPRSLPRRDVTPATSDTSFSTTSSPCSSLLSLSDSFNFGKTLSQALCPGSLTHSLSPQP